MIPQPYKDNFNTLDKAFSNGAVCLLECHDRATGNPAYVICAVNHQSPDYQLVPFARLFDDNPYELLAPPEGLADQPTGKEPRP